MSEESIMKRSLMYKKFTRMFVLIWLVALIGGTARANENAVSLTGVEIEWNHTGKVSGRIDVKNGELAKITILVGSGKVNGSSFSISAGKRARIAVHLANANTAPGPLPTAVTVLTKSNPFTFLLRDVTAANPVYVSVYGAVVLPAGDARSYGEVAAEMKGRGLVTKLDAISNEEETSFENLDPTVRNQYVPTWLGTSRDIRIFQINEKNNNLPPATQIISPRIGAKQMAFEPAKYQNVRYSFIYGRGESTAPVIHRRLEDGVLPILHSQLVDDDIRYHNISFAVNEKYPLNQVDEVGTNYLVASNSLHGANFSDSQKAVLQSELEKEQAKAHETVLCWQVRAINDGRVPRYAWFKTPIAIGTANVYDAASGVTSLNKEYAFCVTKMDGEPLTNQEVAVLVQPGDSVVFDVYLFHKPVSKERIVAFEKAASFATRYADAKQFWSGKLKGTPRVQLPEKRLQEMMYAGLLHMDLISYGKKAEGVLAATIGVYPPIGTESSPIIQYYLSMGWTEEAKRSIQYFLDKQHENGMMQNFGHYMVETGGALWTLGEYFRYTKDRKWAADNKEKILRSVNYLLNWRNENKADSLGNRGYGMIKGKVADPPDHFHQYMLNGYAYLGVKRVAEIYRELDPDLSKRLADEAEAWRRDILASFRHSIAYAPVVPLGDGTWSPTAPPWTEIAGPRALYLEPDRYHSHGTFLVPDAMLGPMYLVFCEVIDPLDPLATLLLNYHSELYYLNNTVMSQPYYSRHNWVQLKRGMVKPFLKTFYNTFASTSDWETYTFWEHLFQVSVHKTHEEAWFLMELRWMLMMEDGDTLHLLKAVPRDWLEEGKRIEWTDMHSYFGPVSLRVTSESGKVKGVVRATGKNRPAELTIRLPHPQGKKPVKVSGGTYDPATETVTIHDFSGEISVVLEF